MKRNFLRCFFSLFLILLSGCVCPIVKSEVAEINRENLSKLSAGMSKRQVGKIMKDKTFLLGGPYIMPAGADFFPMWTIKNPYKSETLRGKDGKSLEVIYYIINYKNKLNKVLDDELTPLIFEDEKLIGWGREFLEENIKR